MGFILRYQLITLLQHRNFDPACCLFPSPALSDGPFSFFQQASETDMVLGKEVFAQSYLNCPSINSIHLQETDHERFLNLKPCTSLPHHTHTSKLKLWPQT